MVYYLSVCRQVAAPRRHECGAAKSSRRLRARKRCEGRGRLSGGTVHQQHARCFRLDGYGLGVSQGWLRRSGKAVEDQADYEVSHAIDGPEGTTVENPARKCWVAAQQSPES